MENLPFPLPPPAWHGADDLVCCPWCKSHHIDGTTITLEQLGEAHSDRVVNEARLDDFGRPPSTALSVDCPDCRRPVMITLKIKADGRRMIALTAHRTAADARFLGAPTAPRFRLDGGG